MELQIEVVLYWDNGNSEIDVNGGIKIEDASHGNSLTLEVKC